MRYLFAVLFIGLIVNLCYADMFVLYDVKSGEVLSASVKDDTIPARGQEIKKMSGSMETFVEHPSMYKISGNKLVLNAKKVSDEELKKQDVIEARQEEELIQREIRNQAIKSLKDKGVILKHLKEG